MTFGDSEPDDAYDTAPPDPEQVARRDQEYRQTLEPGVPSWHELTDDQRARAIERVRRLLAWLERSGWDRWARAI